ncbi:MAG: 2-oxo acid dehydrogenase subunit E2 [Desulfobacterales bacterium]|nr:2-oxo acid dehydrogenase subunit E2 [Desulfobacterales bacterium]
MLYEIRVPEAGFSVKEAVIVEWKKEIGEKIEEGETILVVETEKVVVEIPSLTAGVLIEIRYKKGETASVGAVLGMIAGEGDAEAIAVKESSAKREDREEAPAVSGAEKVEEAKARPGRVVASSGSDERRKISPLARKIAEEKGVDLSLISVGSGPGGRITKEDVLKLISEKKPSEGERREGPQKSEEPEKIKFVGWRKVIADRMISSAREVPQGRTLVEIDVTDLAKLISSVKNQGDGIRITYLPFLMKAIQAGIEVTPEVNAYCYDDGFVLQKELNIGVAVEVGEKLVVPVVKKVRDKSILELGEEIRELAQKARSEKLKPEDVQKGTITITNLGPFDVYAAVPLILQPQTSIVAIGTVREVAGVVNGAIQVRKKVMVTGVFDHRAVNGAPGARFLKTIKSHLEDLNSFILGLR